MGVDNPPLDTTPKQSAYYPLQSALTKLGTGAGDAAAGKVADKLVLALL